ncbi:MAG: DUF2971 domain-containing protein [Eubacteriales bacterium]
MIGYHYCSIDTFVSIIESGNLRLSNGFIMNDSRECRWGFDIYREEFQKRIEKMVSDKKEILEYALFDIESSGDDWVYEDYTPYITCFSKQKDLLSQWRGYGDDGYGVAIGFDLNQVHGNSNKILQLYDVEYDIKQQKKKVEKLLDAMRVTEDNTVKYRRMKEIVYDIQENFVKIIQLSTSIKNPAFIEEQEKRLVYFESNQEVNSESKIKISELKYRATRTNLISYVEVDFNALKREGVIKEIVIGPKAQVTAKEIAAFINRCGYSKTTIQKSQATYC